MNRNKKNLAVGELMRKNAYIMKRKQKVYLKVSPSAVKEYIARIICNIEINMPRIAESTYKSGRTTIMVKDRLDENNELVYVYDDITAYFGCVDSKIVSGTHIYCTRCLKKLEKEREKS